MHFLEFASLQVRDLEKSKKFYVDALGFELAELSNPDAVIFKFKPNGASFAIRKPLGPLSNNKELGEGVSLWFSIEGEIDELYSKFETSGINVLGKPFDTPFGKAFHIKDPDGYKLTFLKK